jgi:hypothetical protein
MMLRRFHTDERGSLTMAMLIITIGIVSSALLTPIVVRQFTSTRSLIARNTELNSAQAGLDTMMAEVRAASQPATASSGRTGLLSDLPGCTLSGNAGATGTSSLPYQVKVKYLDADGTDLGCPPDTAPTTAQVISSGIGPDGKMRTLSATYVFSTSNNYTPGGSVRIDSSSPSQLCFDAGSSKSPPNGTPVTMQVCNGSSRQQFGYTVDLFLKLINSDRIDTTTPANNAPDGMCLVPVSTPVTATSTAATTHANNQALSFEPCPVSSDVKLYPGSPVFQWSLDGSSRFEATKANQGVDSTYCVNMSANTVGSGVFLGACGTNSQTNIWRSSPGVGAGMAGDNTNQLVNYAQFSRCLDVTSQSFTATYMIAWFCKQAPNKAIDWNQQWFHPTPQLKRPTDGSDETLCGTTSSICATGNITISNGTKIDPVTGLAKLGTPIYCLKSPLSTASNAYAIVVACPNGSANASVKAPDTGSGLMWTVYHNTGSYTSSYQIKDTSGNCLTPTDLNATPKDVHTDGTSKVKVTVCSSNELQKWNAPPNISNPTPLTDLREQGN